MENKTKRNKRQPHFIPIFRFDGAVEAQITAERTNIAHFQLIDLSKNRYIRSVNDFLSKLLNSSNYVSRKFSFLIFNMYTNSFV